MATLLKRWSAQHSISKPTTATDNTPNKTSTIYCTIIGCLSIPMSNYIIQLHTHVRSFIYSDDTLAQLILMKMKMCLIISAVERTITQVRTQVVKLYIYPNVRLVVRYRHFYTSFLTCITYLVNRFILLFIYTVIHSD